MYCTRLNMATVLYKGLPSYNSACVKHKRSMIVQRANEAIYYTTNDTRFN